MESFDAEGAPVPCPWFYPVVEQHDVTYHRVKPLAGHRERHTGREPHQMPTKHSLERSHRKQNNSSAGWDEHRRLHHQQAGSEAGSPTKSDDSPTPQGQQDERSPQPRSPFPLLGLSACCPRQCFSKEPVNFCRVKVTQCSGFF